MGVARQLSLVRKVKGLAGLGIHRREIAAHFAMEQQPAGGGQHAGIIGLLRAGQRLFPDDVAGLDVQRPHQARADIGGIGIVAEDAALLR